jgi:hypothetical protein
VLRLWSIGLVLFFSGLAQAKEAAVVVVQHGRDQPLPETAVTALRRAIEQSDELTSADPQTIAKRISSKLGSPAPPDTTVPERLAREAGELLEAVAFGRDDEAISRSTALMRREAERLTATNRSDDAAQALGDICLYAVRALSHRGDALAARIQARECLRLVPDLDPSVGKHPEAVRTLLASVRSEAFGRLGVTVVPPAPASCTLRIQGRAMSKLPAQRELVPGTYAVQADCDGGGLVQDVVIKHDKTEQVVVAPRLERALRLDQPWVLHSALGESRLRDQDLIRFAEWLSVAELWIVERAGAGLRITRWERMRGGFFARGQALEPIAPLDSLVSRMSAAGARLLCSGGSCVDARRESPSSQARLVWGIAGGIGVAGMLGSWAAWIRCSDLDAERADLLGDSREYSDNLDERNKFSTIATVSTFGGSALFVAASQMLLPEARPVPWWAWTAGGVGAAAAGVGTLIWTRAIGDFGECPAFKNPPPDGSCSAAQKVSLPLAPMLVSQGASLIALPVTYLIRDWTRSDTGSVGVLVSPNQIALGWRQELSSF